MFKRLGLLVFSAMFLYGGWGQVAEVGDRGERARQAGLPVSDEVVRGHGLLMVLAALALQIGALRRVSALILAAQMPAMTYVGHPFWELEPGPQRRGQLVNFMKNVSLLGGALYVAATADDD